MAETTTVAVRATGVDATDVYEEGMTADTAGTGVRAGFKGIHPTPPISKMISGISAVTRPTVTEVGWYDQ